MGIRAKILANEFQRKKNAEQEKEQPKNLNEKLEKQTINMALSSDEEDDPLRIWQPPKDLALNPEVLDLEFFNSRNFRKLKRPKKDESFENFINYITETNNLFVSKQEKIEESLFDKI